MPGKVRCPNCGAENEENGVVCVKCHKALPLKHVDAPPATRVCPFCGALNFSEATFCNRCGFKLLEPCPLCQGKNPFEAVTCLQCGTPLTATREHLLNLQRRLRRFSVQTILLFIGALLLLTLAFIYWRFFSNLISIVWLRFLPLLALTFFFFLILLTFISAYYNWREAKKEERHLGQRSRKRK